MLCQLAVSHLYTLGFHGPYFIRQRLASFLEPKQISMDYPGSMVFGWFGILGPTNTTGWPPLVFQGLTPMEQKEKSRPSFNIQAKYQTPQMPLAGRQWVSQG